MPESVIEGLPPGVIKSEVGGKRIFEIKGKGGGLRAEVEKSLSPGDLCGKLERAIADVETFGLRSEDGADAAFEAAVCSSEIMGRLVNKYRADGDISSTDRELKRQAMEEMTGASRTAFDRVEGELQAYLGSGGVLDRNFADVILEQVEESRGIEVDDLVVEVGEMEYRRLMTQVVGRIRQSGGGATVVNGYRGERAARLNWAEGLPDDLGRRLGVDGQEDREAVATERRRRGREEKEREDMARAEALLLAYEQKTIIDVEDWRELKRQIGTLRSHYVRRGNETGLREVTEVEKLMDAVSSKIIGNLPGGKTEQSFNFGKVDGTTLETLTSSEQVCYAMADLAQYVTTDEVTPSDMRFDTGGGSRIDGKTFWELKSEADFQELYKFLGGRLAGKYGLDVDGDRMAIMRSVARAKNLLIHSHLIEQVATSTSHPLVNTDVWSAFHMNDRLWNKNLGGEGFSGVFDGWAQVQIAQARNQARQVNPPQPGESPGDWEKRAVRPLLPDILPEGFMKSYWTTRLTPSGPEGATVHILRQLNSIRGGDLDRIEWGEKGVASGMMIGYGKEVGAAMRVLEMMKGKDQDLGGVKMNQPGWGSDLVTKIRAVLTNLEGDETPEGRLSRRLDLKMRVLILASMVGVVADQSEPGRLRLVGERERLAVMARVLQNVIMDAGYMDEGGVYHGQEPFLPRGSERAVFDLLPVLLNPGNPTPSRHWSEWEANVGFNWAQARPEEVTFAIEGHKKGPWTARKGLAAILTKGGSLNQGK